MFAVSDAEREVKVRLDVILWPGGEATRWSARDKMAAIQVATTSWYSFSVSGLNSSKHRSLTPLFEGKSRFPWGNKIDSLSELFNPGKSKSSLKALASSLLLI